MCTEKPDNATWDIYKLAQGTEEKERKPNPVVQRVKIIMSLGLVVVHLHSRFLSQVTGVTFGFTSSFLSSLFTSSAVMSNPSPDQDTEQVSLQQHLWWKLFNFSLDQVITITLATVLLFKYIFFDKNIPSPRNSTLSPVMSPSSPPQTPLIPPGGERSRVCASDKQPPTSHSSPPVMLHQSVAIQTEPTTVASLVVDHDCPNDEELEDEIRESRHQSSVARTPRSVEECLRLLKFKVNVCMRERGRGEGREGGREERCLLFVILH